MKEVNHEVYFQHADKHQRFLQVNITILGVHVCVCIIILFQSKGFFHLQGCLGHT